LALAKLFEVTPVKVPETWPVMDSTSWRGIEKKVFLFVVTVPAAFEIVTNPTGSVVAVV
jgi:hypothetical protein